MIAVEPKRRSFCFGSTYEAYKKGTADVALFLKDRAREIGYKFATISNVKTHGNVAFIGTNSHAQETYLTSSDQYIAIATAITQARKKGKNLLVPDWLMTRLDDTIKSRRRVADFYGKLCLTDTSLEEDHEKHLYFILVLEKVQHLLAPLVKGKRGSSCNDLGEKSANCNDSPDSRFHQLANRFGNLPLHVPTGSKKVIKAAPISQKPALEFAITKPSSKTTVEEELVPLHCFFLDIEELRNYVSQVWTEYAEGKESIDLMTAALLTNTAIELALSQFEAKFPDNEDYSQIVARYVTLCKGNTSQETTQVRNIHHLTMFHTMEAVKQFKYQRSQKFLQQRKKDQAEVKTVISLCGNSSSESLLDIPAQSKKDNLCDCKYEEDHSYLIECLTELWAFTDQKTYDDDIEVFYNTCGDEIHYAIWNYQHISKGDRVTFWAVIAMEMMLSAYKCLKNAGSVSRPLQQLHSAAKVTKASITLTTKGPALAVEEHKYLTMHTKMAETFIDDWAIKDVVDAVKSDRFPKKYKKGLIRKEPFFLLRHNPIICGIIQFRLMCLAGMHAGLEIATMTFTVQAPIHLYNALRLSGVTRKEWKDSEWFIENFTEQGVFKSSRPMSVQRCLKGWNDHINHNPLSPMDYWAKTSPVMQFFNERFGPNISSQTWDINTLVTITTDSRTTACIPYKDEERYRRLLKYRRQTDSTKGKATDTPQKAPDFDWSDFTFHDQKSSNLKAGDLLKGLRVKLEDVSPKIRFDYLSMHRRGFDLQVGLRNFLKESFSDLFAPEDFQHDIGLSMIMGNVIRWISGYSPTWRRFPQVTLQRREEMARAVGTWFDDYLEKNGSAELDKMNMMRKYF